MIKIEKQEILEPLLAKYYPNEDSFNDSFKNLIQGGGNLYPSAPFGISINISNIVSTEEANHLVRFLENVESFKQTLKAGFDHIDERMFEKGSIFSFKRWIFISKQAIKTGIKDKDNKDVNFFIFINIARTNLDHHIVSFTFTTWDESKIRKQKVEDARDIENAYVTLSNKQIIDLVSKDKDLSLFSIVAGLEKDLNRDNIPKRLKKEFKTRGYKLSNNATVKREKGEKWRIHDKRKIYVILKENEKLKIFKKGKELERAMSQLGKDTEDLLKIDKNTFISFQFWRDDWKSDKDNLLDAKDFIKKNPHYFYSIITLDENIFRRNYKTIMDVLGFCFSTSSVYLGIISQNAYLEVTLKPIIDRFNIVGHDSSIFKSWEILGFQKYLLDQINIKSEYTHEAKKLIGELNKVLDFNLFIQKREKGESWIKLNRYMQNIIGISSDYELYENRYEKKKEEEDRKRNLKLTRLNAIFTSLILATIFVSIFTFLYYEVNIVSKIFRFFLKNSILNLGFYSLFLTFIVAVFFIFVFLIFYEGIIPIVLKVILKFKKK